MFLNHGFKRRIENQTVICVFFLPLYFASLASVKNFNVLIQFLLGFSTSNEQRIKHLRQPLSSTETVQLESKANCNHSAPKQGEHKSPWKDTERRLYRTPIHIP